MAFLQGGTLLQFQKGVDHLLAVVEDRPQFLAALVAHADHVPERNGLACKLGGDRSTKKAVLIEDADFAHVSGVEADRSVLAHVSRQSERSGCDARRVVALASSV